MLSLINSKNFTLRYLSRGNRTSFDKSVGLFGIAIIRFSADPNLQKAGRTLHEAVEIKRNLGRKCIWTEQEESKLLEAVEKHGTKWNYISLNYFQSTKSPASLNQKFTSLQLKRKRSSYHNPWTREEDEILKRGVSKYGVGDWVSISELLQNRDNVQIYNRWQIISKTKRGRWTDDEHKLLLDLIDKHGQKWTELSDILNRPAKCIQSYYEYNIVNKKWTAEENNTLYQAIKEYGENWDIIMKYFPYRTVNNVKFHFQYIVACNPNINKGRWNEKEIAAFDKAFKKYGKKWKLISQEVKTRTPQQCKDHIKRQLLNLFK
ncbi:6248_t:CDS:1 [Acaulospora morrowiae]|uniref:6248_t:CDS:1 n=1 Tax=Acaulospora morrowiae TaxID=94023 RepID=A0A9N9AUA3_9GLOM|nr:6248_t:CDS:1 [Acaulospora morrowiae]